MTTEELEETDKEDLKNKIKGKRELELHNAGEI